MESIVSKFDNIKDWLKEGAGESTKFHCYLMELALALNAVKALEEENKKLQAFKDYVHKRLDDAGVPVDPDSIHKEHGCRIGGRLDFVFQENARLREALEWAKSVFLRLADEGKYPEFLFVENGGDGIMPIVKALQHTEVKQ